MPATATARAASPTVRRARTQTSSRPRAAVAAPRPQTTRFAPAVAVGRTAVAVGGIADSGLVYRLTRGRLWIGLLGTLLVGIVGLNVMALSFSASSSTAASQADELERTNSALKAQMASILSTDELERVASKLGLVVPAPGAYRYVKSGDDDAATAAERLRNGDFSLAAPLPETPVVDPTTVPVVDPAVVDPALTTPVTPTTPVETAPVVNTPVTTPTDPTTPVATAPVGGVAVP